MTIQEELEWRGLFSGALNGGEKLLKEGETFYVGTDPTSIKKENLNPNFPEITSSLHCGHLLAFMVAKLLQHRGMKPIVLIGTATSALGDPSGKFAERSLISKEEIASNTKCIESQLRKLIDFDENNPNHAIMAKNNEWMDNFSFVDFARNVGKYITVNYMLAKEAIKSRLEREGVGISFTEFCYSLLQGYDMLHLYKQYGCKLEIFGRDQISNVTTSFELGRKSEGITELGGIYWDLLCDANGKKFGKSEGGKNVWLNPHLTTPYEFYQFWMNQSDEESKRFIKMFTLLSREEIESLIEEHEKMPQKRILQSTVAREVTTMVHSKEEYEKAVEASKILFGGGTADALQSIDEATLLSAMSGVPTFEVSKDDINNGINLIDIVVSNKIISSKNEYRKLVNGGGLSVNKSKVSDIDLVIKPTDLLNDKYLLIQKGKKNYNLVIAK